MIKTIAGITLFLFLFNFSYANFNQNDTSKITITEIESLDVSRALDSLLNIWYVANYYKEKADTAIAEGNITLPLYSDSVIADRLNRLPMMIDMTYNETVRSFIDLYTIKRRKQVRTMMGLAEYYFPIFEEILDSYGLPLELKYLPVIESALNPRAVSRAGATGIWQFMYTTGKLYKLKINTFVDERRDPIKSSRAAAEFLKDLYDIYGDWTLALAAYNCGPGNVNKAIKRSNGSTDFWVIYEKLPRETRAYVPAFIAAAYTMEYYKDYSIVPHIISFPLVVDTVQVTDEIHFGQISEVLSLDIRLLQDLNPQYRKDIIPATGDTFALILPSEYSIKFIELKDSICKFKDSVYFKPSVGVITSPVYSAETYVASPPSENMTAIKYTVKAGDNLGHISNWFDVKLNDLKYWNNLDGNMIHAGQKLNVYVNKNEVDKYSKINEMSFAQKQAMIGKTDSSAETVQTVVNTTVKDDGKGNYIWYTVKSGDNFWTIAKKYDGVSNTDIMQLNGITDPGSLKPGQKLKIKRIK
jgi:membrane-bound lytic murein transglycosylase D